MVPRLVHRTLPALAVLPGLILLPALATARPLGPAPDGGRAVMGLLVNVGAKNGMTIDPDGTSVPAGNDGDNGMLIDPDGASTPSADGDNGMSIDPDG